MLLVGFGGWLASHILVTHQLTFPRGTRMYLMDLLACFDLLPTLLFLCLWESWLVLQSFLFTRLPNQRGSWMLLYSMAPFLPLALAVIPMAGLSVLDAIANGEQGGIWRWCPGFVSVAVLTAFLTVRSIVQFRSGLRTKGASRRARIAATCRSISFALGLAAFCVWLYTLNDRLAELANLSDQVNVW